MRDAFLAMFPIKSVIVARPVQNRNNQYIDQVETNRNGKKTFLYPVFPRYFKNIEVICEAARNLDPEYCQVLLTMNGSENAYSRDIYSKYKSIPCIKWVGIRSREEIMELYNLVDCLLFSSTMETWGLPISEFKQTGKSMILIDLPYAHETLGDYEKVMFFNSNDLNSLLDCMKSFILEVPHYTPNMKKEIAMPYANGWSELLDYIRNRIELSQ
ncbi:glycosyltransferase [Erysipelotrichaceae bacterium RD49]|nr:glycosyltransferase [Erysipelotrichaceae bacterium RD49]